MTNQSISNAVNWFEIFVTDLGRAARFYQAVLGVPLRREDYAHKPTVVFPAAGDGVGGALVEDPERNRPDGGGTLIYLNANGKLDACLGRVVEYGGAVVLPKTDIGEPGFIALVRDTEGNTVGLHSER